MDKRFAGLLGAAAALTTLTAAHATAPIPSELSPPMRYQDLLAPIPNAVAALKADDARLARTPVSNLKVAQAHHHHHHHHRPPPPHHHHHHHHND
jgi:hypothetical protein